MTTTPMDEGDSEYGEELQDFFEPAILKFDETEPIEISCRLTVGTTVAGFIFWLKHYMSLERSSEFDEENQRQYSSPVLSMEPSDEQLHLLLRAEVLSDYYLEVLKSSDGFLNNFAEVMRKGTEPSPSISLIVASIGTERIKIDLQCVDRILNGYCVHLLRELAIDWPSVADSSCTLFFENRQGCLGSQLTIADLIAESFDRRADRGDRYLIDDLDARGSEVARRELGSDGNELPAAKSSHANKKGVSQEVRQRAHEFRKIKDENPDLSQMAVAMRYNAKHEGANFTANDVRNCYRAMKWDWPKRGSSR